MKRWWMLWGGHVWLAVCILLLIAAGLLFWAAVRATTAETIFGLFVVAAVVLLLGIVVGAIAASQYRNHFERWYIRKDGYVRGATERARTSWLSRSTRRGDFPRL